MSRVQYKNWAVDSSGDTVGNTVYHVRVADTGEDAVIYTSATGGTVAENPGTAEVGGSFTFFADPGLYTITIGSSPSDETVPWDALSAVDYLQLESLVRKTYPTYTSESEALGDTVDGQTFSLLSGNYLSLYRNDSGLATLIGDVATKKFNFESRSDAVSYVTSTSLPEGFTVSANGVSYLNIPSGHPLYGTDPIPDMPGWVWTGHLTPLHFGATGDGINDDAIPLNSAFTAFRQWVHAVPEQAGACVFDGLGLGYKSTASINATLITGFGYKLRDFVIFSEATGKAALDMIGSRGGSADGVFVVGDEANMPRVGIQFARADPDIHGANKNFCDNWRLNVKTTGFFEVAGLWCYGQETTTYDHLSIWNSYRHGTSAIHVGRGDVVLGGVVVNMASDYATPITTGTSFINDRYINCDYRRLPTEDQIAIATDITNSNPMVVTTDRVHGFSIGDLICVNRSGDMTEIENQKYQVTATTPTTVTFGAVDSTSYGTYASDGAQLVIAQSTPTVIFGRGNDHKFVSCYSVNYGHECNVEIQCGSLGPKGCHFEFLFEGAAFDHGFGISSDTGVNVELNDVVFKTFQLASLDSFVGAITTGASEVTLANSVFVVADIKEGSPTLLNNKAKFKLNGYDIFVPSITEFEPSGLLEDLGGVITYGDTGRVVGGTVRRMAESVATSITEEYLDSSGVVDAWKRYTPGSGAFGWSLTGASDDYLMQEAAFYPATNGDKFLGLASRYWQVAYVNEVFAGGARVVNPQGGFVFASYAQSEFADASNAVNTNYKAAGVAYRNSSTGQLMMADGGAPTDAWRPADGSAITIPL